MKLLMLTLEAPKAAKFIDDFERAYNPVPEYLPASHKGSLQAASRDVFRRRRRETIANFIQSNGATTKDDPRAFLAEWATYLCLNAPLESLGYQVDLAPENLESGYPGRRGIDLIISDTQAQIPMPLLGINIKLQRLAQEQRAESHHFDPVICAPSINVSLGNWQVITREQEEMQIREWINQLALPKILDTGKVPYLRALRKYVVDGIHKTLGVYTWKHDQYYSGQYDLNEHQQNLFPTDTADAEVFETKLFTAYQLFSELDEKTCI